MAFFPLFSDFVASFIPSLLYCSHATLGLYKKVFLLCLFAKSVVTRMTSKHNFIEKSLSLSVSFSSSPQFFLLF